MASVLWACSRTKEYPAEEYAKYNNLEQKEIEQFNEFAKDNPDAIANLGKLLNSKLDYNKIYIT